MLDLSKKILRFRNRCGTSGNAMEIFNTSGWVAALSHTYFRVVCCCLSIFLASVFLVRVLHPCVALALWKLLRGCGWAMTAACSRGGRISLTVFFLVCNCSVLWPNCGKHLTNSFVLHFFAARMKVESILQALCNCHHLQSQDWMKVEINNQKRLKKTWGVYPVLINVSCLKKTGGFNMFQPPKKLIENAQWLLPRHGWRCSAATQVIGIPPVPPRYWTPRQSLFKLMNDDGFR